MMENAPGLKTLFRIYRADGAGKTEPVQVAAATPYDAALSLGEGAGDIVVISPNGIESRFGYRTRARLEHLDD